MKKSFTALLLLLVSFTVSSKSVTVHVAASSAQFQVKLDANATTGFRWDVQDYDRKTFTLLSSEYENPKNKRLGAPGISVFTFQLNPKKSYPKKTVMHFNYWRPWEAKQVKPTKVTVYFGSSIRLNGK